MVNTTSQPFKPVKKIQNPATTTNKKNKNSVLPQLGVVPLYHQPLFKLPIPKIPKQLERTIMLITFLVLYLGFLICLWLSWKEINKRK